ncbi:MAG: ribosome maturation factor RimM [Thermoanaerobaculum sp.]|nr:ribosome maturation factor RimM [Thermoanaerobaculum sp.]
MSRPTRFLAVGRVRKPHGVHGELLVEVLTDFPQRLAEGVSVGLGEAEPQQFLTVKSVRWHKGAWLVKLLGLTRREQAEALRGWHLFLPEQERQDLPPTYYYEHDLIGLRCQLADGREAGLVERLEAGPAGAWLVVKVEEREVLVPFVSPIVVRVDLGAGVVILDPPEGLIFGHAL